MVTRNQPRITKRWFRRKRYGRKSMSFWIAVTCLAQEALIWGKWTVVEYKYLVAAEDRKRKIYRFVLKPCKYDLDMILNFLTFSFHSGGTNRAFEKELHVFASARHKFYLRNRSVIRVQDNIIGEIGEYFAIKEFNRTFPITSSPASVGGEGYRRNSNWFRQALRDKDHRRISFSDK